MKKKIIMVIILGVILSAFLISLRPSQESQLQTQGAALAKTLKDAIAKDGEGNLDFVSEDGLRLVFQSKKTLNFLLKALESATFLETTGTASATWPAPLYYVGGTMVGGNYTFVSAQDGRTFQISFAGQVQTQFKEYVIMLIEAGELSGIWVE